MRFSIAKLLYFVGLIAICFAIGRSENAGDRRSLVTSMDFSPDGKQLVVALLEYNGLNRGSIGRFDRTISLLDYPSLQTQKVLIRDQQNRTEPPDPAQVRWYTLSQGGSDLFFWNCQTKVVQTEQHVFYLDSNCQRLFSLDLNSGKARSLVDFKVGQILDFDVSDDGHQIIFQGETVEDGLSNGRTGSVVSVGDERYLVTDEGFPIVELGPETPYAFPYHDVLGIQAENPIAVPVDPNQPLNRSVQRDDGETQQTIQIVQDNDIFQGLTDSWSMQMHRNPIQWRLAFADRRFSDPPAVLVVATDELKRLDFGRDAQRPIVSPNQPVANWFSGIVDLDVSHGPCRCARLLQSGKIRLSLMIDAIPQNKSVDVVFRCNTSVESRIGLSQDGQRLALTHQNSVEVFKVGDLIPEYQPGMIREIERLGGLRLQPEKLSDIQLDAKSISVVFSPDGQRLLIGDDQGFISVVDCETGQLTARAKIPAKSRGLRKEIVVPILVFWLVIGVAWASLSRIKSLPPQQ